MDRRKVLLLVAAFVAALGTLLVFLYVKGADSRADERYAAVNVLRATKPIAVGETVEAAQAAGKIATGQVSSQDVLPGALTTLESVQEMAATVEILPGEQIVETKFGVAAEGTATTLGIPEGKIAISVNLDDPSRVAGFLQPGNRVAVFMAGNDAKGPFSRLLLPNVQVLGLGDTSTEPVAAPVEAEGEDAAAAAPEVLPKTLLTLAVTQREAERVMYATQNGTLALGLLNDDSEVAPSQGVDLDNLFR
ncbi:Flp pilus assembly protein CpaB [Nocardioides aurantiacus]|uniref:Pilus assembly protein CpaB n=1 Tax=Nocardioides aurantiacus TaxID=86796 RepID=A0A3N2CSG2_9ACTN|nr:Flp pilus assembly protein CpaB [Nocardioides aurantiacus]ROR90455.1 pilus assembly protein CpaB [Nocardioides aurantiacus]